MLYTHNKVQRFRAKSLFSLTLMFCLYSLSLTAHAEEKIIIPQYDNGVYSDGSERWNFQPYQQNRIVLKKFSLEKNHSYYGNKHFLKNSRFDRQNDHIPMTFSIYTNGYCVYQEKEQNRKLWSFERTNLKFSHRPTLYVGFEQAFF